MPSEIKSPINNYPIIHGLVAIVDALVVLVGALYRKINAS